MLFFECRESACLAEQLSRFSTQPIRLLSGIIDFSGTVDLNQEKNRLLKEEAACAKEVEFYKSKLSNDEFLKKAPAHVLEKQRAKLNAAIEKLKKTKQSLAELHFSE